VVVHRFGGDEHGVRAGGEGGEELVGGAALEVGVLEAAGGLDGGGGDAVEVLEVGADVGEAVLDRFGAAHARGGGGGGGRGGWGREIGARRHGGGDVAAVGEDGVDGGLLAVRCVERG